MFIVLQAKKITNNSNNSFVLRNEISICYQCHQPDIDKPGFNVLAQEPHVDKGSRGTLVLIGKIAIILKVDKRI